MSEARVFPTWMHHPSFQEAVSSAPERPLPGQLRPDKRVQAVPIKFPPVLVHSEEDEAYYESKGYVSQTNDPVAFSRLSRPAAPTPPPQTVNGIPAAQSTALVSPDGFYPRYVGDEIARDPFEEWEICQRTGAAYEGPGGSADDPVYPPGLEIAGRGSSRHEPVVHTPRDAGEPVTAPAKLPQIDQDEWEAFQAWKASQIREGHPAATAVPRRRRQRAEKPDKPKRQISDERRAQLAEALSKARAAVAARREARNTQAQESENGTG